MEPRVETPSSVRKIIESTTPPCYDFDMTIKERMIEAVKALPDDAGIEDAMERFLFIAKVEKGLEQADRGQTIPHEEIKLRASKWLE